MGHNIWYTFPHNFSEIEYKNLCWKSYERDFPGGPVVKIRLPMHGTGISIPDQGIKIPHAAGQLNPHAKTTELMHLNERARVPQTTEPMRSVPNTSQLQSPRTLEPTRHN